MRKFKEVVFLLCLAVTICFAANSRDLSVICCYAPTEDTDEDEKDRFYGQLQDILNSAKKGDITLVLGDFNAKVGTDSDLWGGVIGHFGIGNCNGNGQRLLQINRNPKRFKVVCYLASWAAYRKGEGQFDIKSIDTSLCTHLVYGFAELGPTNTILSYDPNLDLEDNHGMGSYKTFNDLKKKNPQLTTLLAIGGWKDGSMKYSNMARNSGSRATFVRSCVDFLLKHNFDGLDLDWLYPSNRGGAPEDKNNFALLLQELQKAFQPHGFLLTVAVAANRKVSDSAYNIPEINRYVDFINVMTYDFHGSWDFKTGHSTPLYQRPDETQDQKLLNVDSTINYWIERGTPRNKLVMGLAFYGRTFTLTNPKMNGIGAPIVGGGLAGSITQESGILSFHEICNHLSKETGWTVVFEKHHQVPYTFKGNQWFAYDDVQSVSLKVEYILKMRLGGAMIWTIDTDDFRGNCFGFPYPLLSVVQEDLNGPNRNVTVEPEPETTAVPPSATPTPSPEPSTTTRKDGIEFVCTREGYFRHPNDCKKFYYCQPTPRGFRTVIYHCGPGTVFDEKIAACGFPSSVPECRNAFDIL